MHGIVSRACALAVIAGVAGAAPGLANSETWPNWHAGNEFRAIRDRSRSQ